MKTILLLASLASPAKADQVLFVPPQQPAPLQMIYDATAEDLDAQEPAPLILAQAMVEVSK